MAYTDYTNQKWKVKSSNTDDCPINTKITFHGSETAVTVKCGENKPYGVGTYDSSSNKIALPKGYEISMTAATPGTPARITFGKSGRFSPRSTGSWTADDNGPWSGDD